MIGIGIRVIDERPWRLESCKLCRLGYRSQVHLSCNLCCVEYSETYRRSLCLVCEKGLFSLQEDCFDRGRAFFEQRFDLCCSVAAIPEDDFQCLVVVRYEDCLFGSSRRERCIRHPKNTLLNVQ